MNFIALIAKNLWRQKTRTALTLLGISIGIATIITLGLVSDALKGSMSSFMGSGKADFTIAQANAADMSFSTIDESRIKDIQKMDGVEKAEGMLIGVTQVDKNPMFILFGTTEKTAKMNEVTIHKGRFFKENADEIIIGKIGASSTKKKVGDTVNLFNRKFKLVGIYQTGGNIQDGGALIPLGKLQELTHRDGKVSIISVKVKEGTDIDRLTARIDKGFANELVTIKSVDELNRVDQGMEIIDAAGWMISALAIVIGGIGVMNTMIISVFDRIREIGVLKALGWRRRTIIKMVLGEAVLVGLGSVVVGSVIGVGLMKLVLLSPAASSFLEPVYSASLWVRATLIALFVALIGGAYPAYKAANLSPMEALRYE